MNVTIATIRTLVRYVLNDFSISMIPGDIFTYVSSSVFTLSESNEIAVSSVLVSEVELGSGGYSYDTTTNKVTISSALTVGDTIEIQYTYYPNYSDGEIEGYIRAAIMHLSVNNYYHFEVEDNTIYPDPNEAEKNLIAIIAGLIAEPNNYSMTLPDVKINMPKDLPLHDKISRVIAKAKHNTHGVMEIL